MIMNRFVIHVDALGIICDCNKFTSEVSGYSKEELIGQSLVECPFFSVCDQKSLEKWLESLHQWMGQRWEEPTSRLQDCWFTCKSGDRLPMYWAYRPRFGVEGEVQSVVLIGNIRQAKQVYSPRVHVDEVLFKALFDHLPLGLVMADLDGNYFKVNNAFADLLGYSKDELIGVNFKDITHKDYVYEDDSKTIEAINGSIKEFNLFKKYVHKEGHSIDVDILVTLINSEVNGSYFVSAVHDLTRVNAFKDMVDDKNRELEVMVRKLEEALVESRELVRTKSIFVGNISHELRTPLNAILSVSDLLLETSLTEDQEDLLVMLQDAAHSLLHQVNDILDFSRLDTKSLKIVKKTFDLKELVEGCVKSVRFQAFDKDLEIVSKYDVGNEYLFIGDPYRIRQVVLNLLVNAVRYTDFGKVTIDCSVVRNCYPLCQAIISVKDTGIGISEGEINRIFEPFYQANSNPSRKTGGIGLGLSIVKNLTDLMEGKISVESQQGKGTVFTLYLPLQILEKRLVKSSSDADADLKSIFSGVNVAVVEDNLVNQKILNKIITSFGCGVAVFDNGAKFLKYSDGNSFDVVFMDCYMPVMDGFTATKAVRQQYSTEELPIIALTASGSAEDHQHAYSVGMNEIMMKPVTMKGVGAVLQKYALARTMQHQTKIVTPMHRYFEAAGFESTFVDELVDLARQDIDKWLEVLQQNASDPGLIAQALHALQGVLQTIAPTEAQEWVLRWANISRLERPLVFDVYCPTLCRLLRELFLPTDTEV